MLLRLRRRRAPPANPAGPVRAVVVQRALLSAIVNRSIRPVTSSGRVTARVVAIRRSADLAGAGGLLRLDQHGQAGRAQELDAGQVDDEFLRLLLELAVQRRTQHGSGEGVHLADDRHRHHAVAHRWRWRA